MLLNMHGKQPTNKILTVKLRKFEIFPYLMI